MPQTEAEELFITSHGATYTDYAATKADETMTANDTRRLAKHMAHALETSDHYYSKMFFY